MPSVNMIGNLSSLVWIVNPVIAHAIVNRTHDAIQIAMVGERNSVISLEECFDFVTILPIELLV